MNKCVQNSAVKTAIFMAILTLMSKLLGFVREMVLANYFGTSYVVDAYVMATTILSVMFGGIIVAISTAYMPILSNIMENEGDLLGEKFTSQVINFFIIVGAIISFVGILFSDNIVEIFATGFQGETANLASSFVKVIFLYIIFYAISVILEAYLQYKGTFLPQIISGYFISISMIVAIIFSAYTREYYLPFGILMGYIIRCLIVWYIAKKQGFTYYKSMELGHKTKEIVKLAFPVFIGSYITYINMFIDKTLASRLAEGSIAALNYASLLNSMIISVTITVLATIIYPKLTQASALKKRQRFNGIIKKGFNIVIILGIPFSLGAILFSSQIIEILFERGQFNEVATLMTSSAFSCYAIGMFFMAANEFLVKVYYSMKDMKTPMIFGGISVIINIVLNLILIKSYAHMGLALASSFAAISNSLMLILGIKIKYRKLDIIESKIKLFKVIFSAIIAVGLSYFINNFFTDVFIKEVQVSLSIIFAIVIYLCELKIFNIEELQYIFSVLNIRDNNNKG